jgi:hypothetical protein
VLPQARIEAIPAFRNVLSRHHDLSDSTFAKRAITGQAAEHYFESHYRAIPEFLDCELTNSSTWGCGFDFKLDQPETGSAFAVEVKGIRTKRGSVLLTELEYEMAHSFAIDFFLVVVRNFSENPFHSVFRDPL